MHHVSPATRTPATGPIANLLNIASFDSLFPASKHPLENSQPTHFRQLRNSFQKSGTAVGSTTPTFPEVNGDVWRSSTPSDVIGRT